MIIGLPPKPGSAGTQFVAFFISPLKNGTGATGVTTSSANFHITKIWKTRQVPGKKSGPAAERTAGPASRPQMYGAMDFSLGNLENYTQQDQDRQSQDGQDHQG